MPSSALLPLLAVLLLALAADAAIPYPTLMGVLPNVVFNGSSADPCLFPANGNAPNASNAFVPSLADGLLVHVPFDSVSSGIVMSSSAGAFSNWSLNSTKPPGDTTYNALPLNTVPGKIGNGVNLLANSSSFPVSRNFLLGPYSDSLKFGDGTSPGSAPAFTYAFWVKVNSMNVIRGPPSSVGGPAGATLFSFTPYTLSDNYASQDSTNGNSFYAMQAPGPVYTIQVQNTDNENSNSRIIVSPPITLGAWNHVAVIGGNTGSAVATTLYFNGAIVGGLQSNPTTLGADGLFPGPPATPSSWASVGALLSRTASASSAPYGSTMYSQSSPSPPVSGPESAHYSAFNYDIVVDEFAMWTRGLSVAEIGALVANGNAGIPLTAVAKAGCTCKAGFVSAGQFQCVPCSSQCATCSGTPSACTTCSNAFATAPSCALTCDAKCAALSCDASGSLCTACAAGRSGPPSCFIQCNPQCAEHSCPLGKPDECTACNTTTRRNDPPTCSLLDSAGKVSAIAATTSNIPIIAGSVGGLIVLIVIIVIVVVICVRRRKGEKPLDYAALMGKPVDADAWERLFPDWMTARYTLPASKAYPVMDEFVRATPLDPRLCAGLAESAPKRGLSDLVVATMAYSEAQADLSMVLLKQLIDLEVSATLSAETLFRTNSASTKFFQSLAKLRAVEYVRKTIGPLVHDTLHQFHKTAAKAEAKAGAAADPEGAGVYMSVATDGMEIDPTRLDEGGSADINKYKLMTVCAAFLDTICRSGASCPQALKEILAYVGQAVARAYPGKEVQGMGGFFFLRLFCPAITSPSEYLITQGQTGDEERRYLVLIAKVLQNAANGVKFGKKEAHMVELNEFIDSSIPKITRFFGEQLFAGANIVMNTYPGPNPPPPPVPAMVRANALCVIHENVRESVAPLTEWLNSHQSSASQPTLDAIMALPPPPAAVPAPAGR